MSRGHPIVVRVEKIFESAENDLTKLYTLVACPLTGGPDEPKTGRLRASAWGWPLSWW